MAPVPSINGEKLFIKVGDGATPTEVFTHPCMINSERGIQFSSNGVESTVPDCLDPEAPAWVSRSKDGQSATLTGAGILDKTSVAMFDAWFRSADTKNVQIWVDDLGYWQGAFHLMEFSVTGNRKEKATVSLSLSSDGVVAPYDATP